VPVRRNHPAAAVKPVEPENSTSFWSTTVEWAKWAGGLLPPLKKLLGLGANAQSEPQLLLPAPESHEEDVGVSLQSSEVQTFVEKTNIQEFSPVRSPVREPETRKFLNAPRTASSGLFDMSYSGKAISSMSEQELQSHLFAAGLPTDGNKEDMTRRLRYFAIAKQPAKKQKTSHETANDSSRVDNEDDFLALVSRLKASWKRTARDTEEKKRAAAEVLELIAGESVSKDFFEPKKRPTEKDSPLQKKIKVLEPEQRKAQPSYTMVGLANEGYLPNFSKIFRNASESLSASPSSKPLVRDSVQSSQAKVDTPQKASSAAGLSFNLSGTTTAAKPVPPKQDVSPKQKPVVPEKTVLPNADKLKPVEAVLKSAAQKPHESPKSKPYTASFSAVSSAASVSAPAASLKTVPNFGASASLASNFGASTNVMSNVGGTASTMASNDEPEICPDCEFDEDQADHSECDWPDYNRKHGISGNDDKKGSATKVPSPSAGASKPSFSFEIPSSSTQSTSGFKFSSSAASTVSAPAVTSFSAPSSTSFSFEKANEKSSTGASSVSSQAFSAPASSSGFSFTAGSSSASTSVTSFPSFSFPATTAAAASSSTEAKKPEPAPAATSFSFSATGTSTFNPSSQSSSFNASSGTPSLGSSSSTFSFTSASSSAASTSFSNLTTPSFGKTTGTSVPSFGQSSAVASTPSFDQSSSSTVKPSFGQTSLTPLSAFGQSSASSAPAFGGSASASSSSFSLTPSNQSFSTPLSSAPVNAFSNTSFQSGASFSTQYNAKTGFAPSTASFGTSAPSFGSTQQSFASQPTITPQPSQFSFSNTASSTFGTAGGSSFNASGAGFTPQPPAAGGFNFDPSTAGGFNMGSSSKSRPIMRAKRANIKK
jgi:hypothetical protein